MVKLELENFKLNGYSITGTKEWINNGLNGNNQFNYTVRVKDGQITTPDGQIIKYSTTNTRTWVKGMATNFWTNGIDGITDDVWEVTGTSTGVNLRGETYTATITTPWQYQANCQWLTSGTTQIETTGLDDALTLDYGNGDCDNKATVSLGTWSREIELK